MSRQVDFSDAMSAAFKFGIDGVVPLLKLGWLPLLIVTVGAFLLLDAGATFDSMSDLDGSDGTFRIGRGGNAELTDVTKPLQAALGGLILFVGLIGFVPVYVGLLRKAARQVDKVGGWRFDGRAWRVIGASILLGLVGILAGVLVAIPFVGIAALTGGQPGPLGVLFYILVGLLAAAGFVFGYVRLMLFIPLAATENRISLGEAWTATRGHFWIIFAGLIVIGIGAAIVGAILEIAGVSLGSMFEVIGPAWLGVALVAMGGILSQIFQNLVSIGFAGQLAHDLRGYGEDEIGEVFA